MLRLTVAKAFARAPAAAPLAALRCPVALLSSTPGKDPRLSLDQAAKALVQDLDMRERFEEIRTDLPAHSMPPGQESMDHDELMRKRLIYRAKQRGWLEVDLLLGNFADAHVPTMNSEELQQFADICRLETIDIYNYLTGKDKVPEEVDTPMMKTLQEYTLTSPVGQASPEGYAKVKKVMSN